MTKLWDSGGAIERDRIADFPVAAHKSSGRNALSRLIDNPRSALAVLALSTLTLSSCVSTSDNQIYGYTPSMPVPSENIATVSTEEDGQITDFAAATQGSETAVAEGDTNADTLTAMAPAQTSQPSINALNVGITQSSNANPGGNLYALNQPSPDSPALVPIPGTAQRSAEGPTEVASLSAPVSTAEVASAPAAETTIAEPTIEPRTEAVRPVALAESQKKKSLFGRFFGSTTSPPKDVPGGAGTKRINQNSLRSDIVVSRASTNSGGGLPGVRLSSLFEIKTGNDEDGENASGVEVASAGGLARLAPRGLHIQTERVDVACLKPQLIKMIKKVERHYGRPAVITSGYRNPKHNRKIGGARNSRHTSCDAADIQVEGVSKWKLAAYLRTMPGRGGVGTYCHTKSVHLDIGTERDWNWRCRRRKK